MCLKSVIKADVFSAADALSGLDALRLVLGELAAHHVPV